MKKNNYDVFSAEKGFNDISAVNIIQQPIDPRLIKTKDNKFKYISGAAVDRLLNKAFNYRWSFEIKETKVIETSNIKSDEVLAPTIQVLGSLTVPGWGVREQYGAAVLVGGANVQENAFKSAATDAKKKCASSFGIALEMYASQDGSENNPYYFVTENDLAYAKAEDQILDYRLQSMGFESTLQEKVKIEPVAEEKRFAQPTVMNTEPVQEQQAQQEPVSVPPQEQLPIEETNHSDEDYIPQVEDFKAPQRIYSEAPVANNEPLVGNQPEAQPSASKWQQKDVNELRDYKRELGLQSNEDLTPYVQEFLDNNSPEINYQMINPSNVADFNIFLGNKLQERMLQQ